MNESLVLTQLADNPRPVLALSADTKDYIAQLIERVGKQGPITTPAEFAQRSADLNALHKAWKFLDEERLRLGRLYDAEKEANVNAVAKPLLTPLAALKASTEKAMQAWDRHVREERARREAEIEAERAKALQMEEEAKRRQEVAAQAVEKATTPEEFEKAAAEFDKGVAVQMQVTENLIAATSLPVPELPKAKGTKDKMKVAELEVLDLGKLPLAYHLPDEAKIKKHILDGVLTAETPGIRFRLEKAFSATGR